MQFSENIFIQMVIVVLGVCGFAVARHIRNHKTKNTALVCPIKFDCHTVVHSDYSKFLGVPVEFLGMIYYAIISFFYLAFIFIPDLLNITHIDLISYVALISLIAFLFSVYLICVQIFILRKGCSWCIVSAFISILIFILTMVK